jgi:predicted lipoprotein with Yx(FWY)xxD motif
MLDHARSTRFRTPVRVFAIATVAVIALAACGDDDDNAPAAAATTQPAAAATAAPATTAAAGRGDYNYGTPSTDATATTAAASGAAAGSGAVMVADSAELGKILVASNGMTLYLYMPDKQGAPTCAGSCAAAWPAATVADASAATAGAGADASLIGTATNPEAGTQLTYNGWPLYFFSGDKAPGDAKGQGMSDVWYAIDATGNAIDKD